MSIVQSVSGMSPAGKTAAGAGTTGVVLTTVGFITGLWVYIAYIAAALVVAVLLILAFKFFLKWRTKGRSAPFVGRLLGTTSGSPTMADPAMRARVDDLRRRFEEGLEKFRAAGKDVYALPWVLMAGPTGSGKTEAIRHCNVGFPPGLHDPLQGTGGTLNMNWWFTNQAVILDTAGKMFMEETGTEWKELMKLLKTWRPLQPINAMILAIGVDSLIKDSAEKIESEASKVARQLDAISRDLDVRFPVYIWVTKCDLLIGFREFTSTISDPALQHQMLGWSNPADLDDPFQPERVTDHLEQVCKRLIRRRGGLLSDPTPQNMQSVNPRRIDETDALFALPESLASIGSRLRRYLELIFVQGEWSSKPLFLRGIYFTSALQEGAELDEAIARAMGVSVEALPGGVQFAPTKKSYFLRDVLTSKVFPEKGLVTRATNVKQQQRGRKLALLASGIGVVLLCIGLTIWGWRELAGRVDRPAKLWDRIGREITTNPERFKLFREVEPGKIAVNTEGVESLEWGTPLGLLTTTAAQTEPEKRISAPVIFKGLAGLLSDNLNDRVGAAHASVTELSVVAPLVSAARHHFEDASKIDWVANNGAAIDVFASLLQIDRAPADGDTGNKKAYFPVASYLRFTGVEGARIEALGADGIKKVESVVEQAALSGNSWPPAGMRASDTLSESRTRRLKAAVDSFNAHWPARLRAEVGPLVDLQSALSRFASAEDQLVTLGQAGVPTDEKAYSEFQVRWNEQYREMTLAWQQAREAINRASPSKPLSSSELDAALAKARKSLAAEIARSYRLVLGISGESLLEMGADAAKAAGAGNTADKVGADAKKAMDATAFMLDREELRPMLGSLMSKFNELCPEPKGEALGGELAKLMDETRAYYATGKQGGVLMTEVAGDPAIKYNFEARYEIFKQASELFAAQPLQVAWGGGTSQSSVSLKDAVAQIETETRNAVDVIGRRSLQTFEPMAGRVDQIKRSGETAVQTAALGRRTAALDSAMAATSERDPAWVKAAVKSLSDQLATAPSTDPAMKRVLELSLPAPLQSRSVLLEPDFDPVAARRVFDDAALVVALSVAAPEKAAQVMAVLEPAAPTRAARLKEAASAFVKYCREYTDRWTNMPTEKISAVEHRSWADYCKALNTGVLNNAATVETSLEKFSDMIAQAIKVVPPVLRAELKLPQGRGLSDWESALESDRNRELAQRRLASVRAWVELGESVTENPATIGATDGKRFAREFFPEYGGNGFATPAARYWNAIRLEALSLIVKEVRGGIDETWRSLEEMKKLPLAMIVPSTWEGPSSKVPSVTLDEVRSAQRVISILQQSVGTSATKREPTDIAEVDELLKKLYAGNPVTEDKRSQVLFPLWKDWLEWVADAQQPCKASLFVVTITVDHKLPPGSSGKYEFAADKARVIKVTTGAGPGVTLNSNDIGRSFGEAIPLAGSPKLLIEYSNVDGTAVGSRELDSGWGVLELLCDPDARLVDGDSSGKKWMVPVRFNGPAGRCYTWIGVEFSKPVPRAAMPTSDKWQ
ncbi:MAG: hypothetical protein GIKADHBN_03233 [Phycisphaerales bacterium]|nr:hypothetical protein [Phycisphaerales bacterium]